MAGIIKARKRGRNADTIWGTDEDGAFLLSGYAVDFAYIQSGNDEIKVNVMCPVRPDTNKEQADTLAYQLQQEIEYQDKRAIYRVARLINIDNKHWCALTYITNEHTIAEVTVYDPLQTPFSIEAIKSVQEIVNEINGNKCIKVQVETGNQVDGYSCLDHSVQKIMQWKGVENEITHAQSSEGLRHAVIAACEKHSSVDAISRDSESESDSEASSSNEVDVSALDSAHEQFEEDLHQKLSNKLYEDRQIKFDEIMARRVHSLFKDKPDMDEKELFRQAREEAFNELFRPQRN